MMLSMKKWVNKWEVKQPSNVIVYATNWHT